MTRTTLMTVLLALLSAPLLAACSSTRDENGTMIKDFAYVYTCGSGDVSAAHSTGSSAIGFVGCDSEEDAEEIAMAKEKIEAETAGIDPRTDMNERQDYADAATTKIRSAMNAPEIADREVVILEPAGTSAKAGPVDRIEVPGSGVPAADPTAENYMRSETSSVH